MENEIRDYLTVQVEKIEDGYGCPFELLRDLKRLENIIAHAKENVFPFALKEFRGEKTRKIEGAEFSVTSGGRYDYSTSHGHTAASENLKKIEERMKIAFKTQMPFVDSETGEVYPMPEYKKNATAVAIKLTK